MDGGILNALNRADFPRDGSGAYHITTLDGQTLQTAQQIPIAAGIWRLAIDVLPRPSSPPHFGFAIRFVHDTPRDSTNNPRTEFDFDAGS